MDIDEGSYAAIACRMLQGGLPYRDEGVENKFPGIFYVYRTIYALFGRYNQAAVHVVTSLVALLTALVCGAIARQIAADLGKDGERASFAASLGYVVFSTVYYPKILAGNTEMFVVLPCALALYTYQRARERPGNLSGGWARWPAVNAAPQEAGGRRGAGRGGRRPDLAARISSRGRRPVPGGDRFCRGARRHRAAPSARRHLRRRQVLDLDLYLPTLHSVREIAITKTSFSTWASTWCRSLLTVSPLLFLAARSAVCGQRRTHLVVAGLDVGRIADRRAHVRPPTFSMMLPAVVGAGGRWARPMGCRGRFPVAERPPGGRFFWCTRVCSRRPPEESFWSPRPRLSPRRRALCPGAHPPRRADLRVGLVSAALSGGRSLPVDALRLHTTSCRDRHPRAARRAAIPCRKVGTC